MNYVELKNGCCFLTTNTQKQTLRSEGSNNVKSIRRATKKNIEWVRAMCGFVPETAKVRKP